jgi:hypothetical protein
MALSLMFRRRFVLALSVGTAGGLRSWAATLKEPGVAARVDLPLVPEYILLGLFLYAILGMPVEGIRAFASPTVPLTSRCSIFPLLELGGLWL